MVPLNCVIFEAKFGDDPLATTLDAIKLILHYTPKDMLWLVTNFLPLFSLGPFKLTYYASRKGKFAQPQPNKNTNNITAMCTNS